MEIASIVSSFVSLILAIIAIWLALYFYTQAKNTEANVQVALEGIKTQTNALQSLNARTLDRLTRYVTTPRNDTTQAMQLLADALKDIPNIVLKLTLPPAGGNEQTLRSEIIHAYIALWHYIATTNIWASLSLPSPESFDETKPNDRLIKQVVDSSAADFAYMTSIIEKLDINQIRATTYAHLYEEVNGFLRQMVGDTAQQYIKRIKQHKNETS